jgi:Tfp pilus assembly protein PilF
MSTMRVCMSSFFCFACTVCLFSVQPHPHLVQPDQGYRTPEQIQAQDALYQGVEAYRQGQYEEALQQFSHAKQLDPKLIDARLYLAATYASQYIPGAPPSGTGKKVELRSRSFGKC